MEVLREPPNASSFVPLAEHQSATPASFYTGPPVLHYHSDRSKVRVLQRELDSAPAFAPLFLGADAAAQTTQNGDGQSHGEKIAEEVDVWVTSEYVPCTGTRDVTNGILQQAISVLLCGYCWRFHPVPIYLPTRNPDATLAFCRKLRARRLYAATYIHGRILF